MGKTARKVTQVALMLAGVGLVGLAGCGNTDYFAVVVTIDPTISSGNLQQVAFCEVMTSGAVSDETDFVLNQSVCGSGTDFKNLQTDSNGDHVIGNFEYGTTKTSGQVHFHINLKDGSQKMLAQGDADGTVGSGVVPVTLKVSDVSGLK